MFRQVTPDFLLDGCLQHHQHETQVGLDSEFIFLHQYLAVHPRAFEVDHLVIPAIIDTELLSEID